MNTVFFDIDTQIDFLFPAGALYVPGAERIVPAIAALNRYAAAHRIPVVSDMDAHTEDDPEFQVWPAHCVAGTAGQQKPASTLLARRFVIPNRKAPVDVEGAEQIIVEKTKLDVFTNPNIYELLARLNADEYVVYGVVTEYCVRCGFLGLLGTGKPVTVVTDAVETLKREDSDRALRELTERGGRLSNISEICAQ